MNYHLIEVDYEENTEYVLKQIFLFKLVEYDKMNKKRMKRIEKKMKRKKKHYQFILHFFMYFDFDGILMNEYDE